MKSILKLSMLICMLVLINPLAKACLDIPTNPPDIIIDSLTAETALIIVPNYTTYGATVADYCGCALNFPALYGQVTSITIVYAGTMTPVPGWTFGQDNDTENGLQILELPPAEWTGFSSAVSQAIAQGIEVDLIYTIENFFAQEVFAPNANNANSFLAPLDYQGIKQHLETANPVVITGGATSDGVIDHHIAVLPANSVTFKLAANDVPALSSWALILFGLMLLSFGSLKVAKMQTNLGAVESQLPFNSKHFSSAFLFSGLLAIVAAFSIYAALGTLAIRDVIGLVLSTVLLSYLLHLWTSLFKA